MKKEDPITKLKNEGIRYEFLMFRDIEHAWFLHDQIKTVEKTSRLRLGLAVSVLIICVLLSLVIGPLKLANHTPPRGSEVRKE